MDEYLRFAKELALEAGQISLELFGFDIAATWKDDNTPLTAADDAINQMVIDRVKEQFPDHGVLGEEDSYEQDRSTIWVVDPIDGTQPFSVGAPLSVFSLALVVDGIPQVGVVYDPFQKRMFTAIKGQGAWLNDEPLKITNASDDLHYIAMASRPAEDLKTNGQIIDYLDAEGIKWFNFRSFIYGGILVAAGTVSAAILGRPKPWDIAANMVILEEAGGKVTNLYGEPAKYNDVQNGFLFSNGVVHDRILAILKP